MTLTTAVAPHAPEVRQERPGWTLAGWLLLAVAIATAVATVMLDVSHRSYGVGDDFDVFRAAGAAVLNGESPYDFSLDRGFMFIYTPFAAICLIPLTLFGADLALGVWTLISLLAMAAVIWISLRSAGVESRRRRATVTLVIAIVALPLTPVLLNLWLGQINIVLMFLIMADLSRRSGRYRGIGVGIAAGIKLTPLIFIGYLLITRQFRAARTAAATFLGTVLIGFYVLPEASWHYWGGMFLDTSRMFPVGADQIWNQSLRGIVAIHFAADPHERLIWLALCVAVGAFGLMVARSANTRGNEVAAIVACGVTGALLSPLSWTPHWVWWVPLLAMVTGHAVKAARRGAPAGATAVWLAFSAQSYFWVYWILTGRPAWPDPSPALLTHLVVLTGLAVLGVLGALAVSRRASARPT